MLLIDNWSLDGGSALIVCGHVQAQIDRYIEVIQSRVEETKHK